MINNNYIYNGKKYALGGLIHGEIDGLLISKDGDADIYDIYLSNGVIISLPEKYGLFMGRVHALSAKDIIVGDSVLLANGSIIQVTRVDKRRGISINVPRELFNLNNILITKNHIPRIWNSKKTTEEEIPASTVATKK